MKKAVLMTIALGCSMAGGSAQSFDLDKKLLDYCEKAKACTLKQIETEQIPEQYRDMVMANMNTMCAGVKEQFTPYLKQEPAMLESAEQCIDSLNKMSCDELMSAERETKECKTFNKMLEEKEQQP
ncbi:hypothetical protein [Kangiella sp. TOML190]|uniref:hypothetical protein n=1 Tax=Kangiella sp. TOML190 TaxID=2931351 RepID=UPI00203F5E5B|nr:hypothetical protein [Kangiella sp. TOML190]